MSSSSASKSADMNNEINKSAYLLLNGSPPTKALIDEFFPPQVGTIIMCADGAYNWAASIVKPDFLVGDFDSIIGDFPSDVQLIQFEVEKDFTDSHLCILKLIEMGATDIKIFGATGGRIDHEAANYCLLSLAHEYNQGLINNSNAMMNSSKITPNHPDITPKSSKIASNNPDITPNNSINSPVINANGQFVKATIIDETFDVTMESGHFCAVTTPNKIISVVPYSDEVHILYTKGLKYPMLDQVLTKRHILGISNMATADFVEVAISQGEALVYLER